jgi:hypothetical protein
VSQGTQSKLFFDFVACLIHLKAFVNAEVGSVIFELNSVQEKPCHSLSVCFVRLLKGRLNLFLSRHDIS